MCVCTHTHMCIHTQGNMHTRVWRPEENLSGVPTSGVPCLLKGSPPCFMSPLTGLQFTHLARLAGWCTQAASCLPNGIPGFLQGFWRWNAGPRVSTAGTLPTELRFQQQLLLITYVIIILSFPGAVQRGAVICLQSHSTRAAKSSPQSMLPKEHSAP